MFDFQRDSWDDSRDRGGVEVCSKELWPGRPQQPCDSENTYEKTHQIYARLVT